jgi:hypothetical protein
MLIISGQMPASSHHSVVYNTSTSVDTSSNHLSEGIYGVKTPQFSLANRQSDQNDEDPKQLIRLS